MSEELINWVGNRSGGYFVVDGEATEVPMDAEFPEIQRRLQGRTITEIQESVGNYVVRLDDGQVVEFGGIWLNTGDAEAGVRFWNEQPT